MKKIDLHIHTVATINDNEFIFSIDKLEEYVAKAGLDAIAITNHNTFDRTQFRSIREALSIQTFPGIEIDLSNCHVLLISDGSNLENFETATAKVTRKITDTSDSISIEEMKSIFGNLNEYLIIPHYGKKPTINTETLSAISPFVSAGEVDSAKKFIRAIKDDAQLTPVLFSDIRVGEDLSQFPTRQTFIDCGELTLDAIKSCLMDKSKICLSESDGNSLFQIFEDGQMMSTGLNVLLGERSSGKTYTLDRIYERNDNVNYIRQFSLVQQDDASYEREFNKYLQNRESRFSDEYLKGFKSILDDTMNVDLTLNDRKVDEYVSTLLKSAEEADRRDSFSKTTLFNETVFSISDDTTLKQLIESVRQLIENVDYRSIIEKHLDQTSLKRLACELIGILWARSFENKKKVFVNSMVKDVKESLKIRSSSVQVSDVDLYRASMDAKKVDRFKNVVESLRKEATIAEESIRGFKIVAKKGPFASAGEVKSVSGVRTAFSDAMKVYDDPYRYLRVLMENENLPQAELYRYFAKITYQILNRDGFQVSGGEKSEFKLLQEIKDAQNFDILLVDEPESSFDNMFLRSDVNEILRDISKLMPVVVVTHNSTVGASIGADYLMYTSKEFVGGKIVYRIYSGHPTDKRLHSTDGHSIANHEIMMKSLEAGKEAYDGRRRTYETIEDRK